MGNTVIIAEKPDVAKKILAALGGGSGIKGGYLCNNKMIVTYTFGHLLEPLNPEDYDDKYGKWDWQTLPIIPKTYKYKPNRGSSREQIKNIKKLVQGAECVIMATDPDREGELIGYSVLNHIGYKGPQKRLWVHDLTPAAIQEGMKNLKPIEDTIPFAHAALARQRADWLVGMNMSRAVTLKIQDTAYGLGVFSIGRVQTPTLALVVRREREIRNFKPQDYFDIWVKSDIDGAQLKLSHAPGRDEETKEAIKILLPADRDRIIAEVKGQKSDLKVENAVRKKKPDNLFDLNSLQQQANKKYGWSADKTLKVTQALYETHQLLSYPRTDCAYLPEEHKENIPVIMDNLKAYEGLKDLVGLINEPQLRNTVYNDKKVGAHYAIIPTNKSPVGVSLNQDERTLYELVCKFWMAAHMPDYEYLQKKISAKFADHPFKATGQTPLKAGWRAIFAKDPQGEDDKGAQNDKDLPDIKDGTTITADNVGYDAQKTKPPARYNEATLLEAMKNVAKYVQDEKAKKTLKDVTGIGTSATRAGIFETLFKKKFLIRQKKLIVPTSTGESLIEAVEATVPDYADPICTAVWEQKMTQIVDGKFKGSAFVKEIEQNVEQQILLVKSSSDVTKIATKLKENQPETKKRKVKHPNPDKLVKLSVGFDDKDKAKSLGAKWHGDAKFWYIPDGVNHGPFKEAGFLKEG